jgi:carbamate kinase
MRTVIALGGNALLRRGEVMSAQQQLQNMQRAAQPLARLCIDHQIAIVHGNGPQIGLLALTAEAYSSVPAYPLDVLGAESQGMIGYIIAQALDNALRAQPKRSAISDYPSVACLLTQTLVDPADTAFQSPSKPIGPVYPNDQAPALRARGWQFVVEGAGIRRVVASPKPVKIVEFALIEKLLSAGVITICVGGGGIPVAYRSAPVGDQQAISSGNSLVGIEAVVDKDFSAALLAQQLGAERLIILTDVDAVYLDWGTPEQRAVAKIQASVLSTYQFSAGSMAPKVAAACAFVSATGKTAAIGALDAAEAVFAGSAGTQIFP